MRTKYDVAVVILVVLLAFFFIIYFTPLISGVIISLTDWNGMSKNFNFVGFDNYIKMFSDTRFTKAARVTGKYALVLLCFSILFGYIIAKAIKNRKHKKAPMLLLAFFPYVVTPIIVCVLWNQLFANLIPLLGKSLNIDFLKTNLLAKGNSALWVVSFVDLWMLIPYSMLLILSALNAIPADLIEYAELENASKWKKFRYIEFPFLLPSFSMIGTVIISYALTNIDTIMALTAGGPGRSTETMYYIVYKNSTFDFSYGLAEGIVISLVSITVFVVINKLTNSKGKRDVFYGGEEA
jgi:raffinose/stachyose/melibiose transport system permease protein